jgi:galactokinase
LTDYLALTFFARSDQTSRLIPFGHGADSPVVVVTNSHVKHELSGSEYPDRVRQCKEAVAAIQVKYPKVKSLRDCTMMMLDSCVADKTSVVYRRARHAITEDVRTLGAVEALAAGDFNLVGKFMNESHNSLRDDYEVSCTELDVLVNMAREVPGVYGSRMTGGGFGGCTVTLVRRDAVALLEDTLKAEFKEKFDKDCECYVVEPSEGAGEIDLDAVMRRKKWADFRLTDWVYPTVAVAVVAGLALRFLANRK